MAVSGTSRSRAALLLERLPPLGRLVAPVEQQVGVVSQLLDARVAVLVGVEARLDQAQGEGGEGEHLAAPGDRLALELRHRHHRVDQAHLEGLRGVVLAAQQPELLGLLRADEIAKEGGAEAAVPGADPRPGLPEDGVVGGDRQVAADVEDVAAADGVAGHHGDDRLRQAAHLHLQVGDVEAPERFALGDVAGVAPDPLVAARAERLLALAGEDDDADLGVLAGQLERRRDLDQRLRAERVEHLRPVDRDLGDPLRLLVADVLELAARGAPRDRRVQFLLWRGFPMALRHDPHDSQGHPAGVTRMR